jgi:hypothetical protein
MSGILSAKSDKVKDGFHTSVGVLRALFHGSPAALKWLPQISQNRSFDKASRAFNLLSV